MGGVVADKKKLKKEMKELRQKAKRALSCKEEFQQEIKRLQQEISLRDQQIGDLQRKVKKEDLKTRSGNKTAPRTLRKSQKKSVATDQREAWKKYSYLRDRYEFYLDDDKDKTEARNLANLDLIERYGSEFGYSEQQLTDILS